MSARQKEEFLKHHHQCVQTLCSVGLCDKAALKRKGLLQLLYLLYSAQIIDKSYYQSLFDCIEQIKESEFDGHMCGANGACSREWKEIIDAFAEAVVELKDYNIKVSRHPSKLPPITPDMLDGDFDMYTIAAFQKTPDPKIVEHPDFVKGKDLHYRVKKLFENIKTRFPELQRQQISILTPPDSVFKKEQRSPFMSTYGDNQASRESDFDGTRLTITKLGEDFDETPKLRSVTSLPELSESLKDKESYDISRESGLFRPSTFEVRESTTVDGLSLPPDLPENLAKSPLKSKRSRDSLPWWWKSSTAKRKKSKKKRKSSRKSSKKKSPKRKSSKKKSPKKKNTESEVKKITIHADKDTIERFRDLNRKGSKSPKKSKPSKKKSPKRKSSKKKSPKKSPKRKSSKKKSVKRKSSKKSSKKSPKKSRSRKSSKKKSVKRKSPRKRKVVRKRKSRRKSRKRTRTRRKSRK